MALQDVDNVFDLEWGAGREVPRRAASRRGRAVEVRLRPGRHAAGGARTRIHRDLFDQYYGFAQTLLRLRPGAAGARLLPEVLAHVQPARRERRHRRHRAHGLHPARAAAGGRDRQDVGRRRGGAQATRRRAR